MADLTELEREVAVALGWTFHDDHGDCTEWWPGAKHWHRPDDGIAVRMPPWWGSDMTECFSPRGPVAAVLTKGWFFELHGGDWWMATFQNGSTTSVSQRGETPAEAICRAFLLAVGTPAYSRGV